MPVSKNISLKTLDGGDLRVYGDGIYPEIRNKYYINNFVMKTAAARGILLTPNQITATIEMMKTKTPFTPPDADLNKIAVKNGVLDVITREFEPHTHNKVFLSKLPVEYTPSCKEPEMFLQALNRTFRGVEYQIPTLQEMFGYCLYRRYSIAAIFFLLGDGDNGKSVILNLLSAMLGDENTSNLTLSDMASPKNEHVLLDLRGKFANVCGDVGKKKIDDTAFLKMLSGKDKIRARGLYRDSVNFTNHAKAIFALNFLPEVDDFTDGFKRRIKIIEFPNKFSGTEKIVDLEEEIIKAGELPGIFNWALEGLERLLENNKFSNEKTAATAGLEYDMKSNPVSYFVRTCIDEKIGSIESTEEVMKAYMDFRTKYRLPVLTKKDFKEKFVKACKEINLTTYEKRNRPTGGDNAARYYGFADVRVNMDDLRKFLGVVDEGTTTKKERGQTEFKTEYTGEQPDKLFLTDMTQFLREHREEAFKDAHSAAEMFCAEIGPGYKATHGLDFIENEIHKRNEAFLDMQQISIMKHECNAG